MKLTYLPVVLILFLSFPSAWAQGKGGQAGKQQGQGQQRGKAGAGQGQGATERDRIQATAQQRDQLRACDRSAAAIRNRLGQLAKGSQGAGFKAGQARQERERLREEVSNMEQEHERFMKGLSNDQQQALQERIRNMDRIRERLRTQQQALDQELGQASPDGKRVAERAREMERTMREWHEQHQAIQSQIVVQP